MREVATTHSTYFYHMNFDNSISYFIYRYLSAEPYQGAKTGWIVRALLLGYL